MTYNNPLTGVKTGVIQGMIEYTDLIKLIEYDPIYGIFKWKKSHGFKKAGTALSLNRITLNGKVYSPGKLAWFYTYGQWPGDNFTYVDGDRCNIRLSNLTNTKIRRRRPSLPVDRLSVAIHRVDDGFRVIHVLGRVSNDIGTYQDYTMASDVQKWLLCSQ